MNYGYGDGEIPTVLLTFYSVFFVILAVVWAYALVCYVLTGLSFMKLYRKLGIEPWAAWVPFFNQWRLLEIGGQPGWIALLSLVSPGAIVALVFECMAVHRIGLAFRKDAGWVVLFVFLPFVWAWLLAADGNVYDPHLSARNGYGPPLAGFGSARGPYVPPSYPPPPSSAT